MNDLFERVRSRVYISAVVAGTAPRSVLLEHSRTRGWCVSTASFCRAWIPGKQLSASSSTGYLCPCERPIVAARVRALQEDGRNPFAEFQVAAAVLALKQGFGA